MTQDLIIKKERYINAPVSKVWDIITETTSDWNGITIKTITDFRPESEIIFAFKWDGVDYKDKGKIIKFEKEKVYSYSYWSAFSGTPDIEENYSQIEYLLESNSTGTFLTLIHSNFATQTMYDHSDKNWEEILDNFKRRAENI